MDLITYLAGLIRRPEKKLTLKQSGVKWEALQKLCSSGSITAWEIQRMGTTAAHRFIMRLKQQGFISHYTVAPNSNGEGTHHVHWWSGKLPPKVA